MTDPTARIGLPDGIELRRPRPDDHPTIVGLMDEWWGGRRVQRLLPRLFLEHFAGTSWLATDRARRPAGFAVGFMSQDDPTAAHLVVVATSPNHRRRGLGRVLVERLVADVAARGGTRITTAVWPANRAAVAFYESLGFVLDEGPGTRPLYGVAARQDHDGEGEDRAVLTLEIGSEGFATR